MQYFSGRFKEKASNLILDFHSTIKFEERLAYYDVMGSIAHVRGLGKQGIIPLEESKLIEKTLREILEDLESGKIKLLVEYEDIHMNIEKNLIDRIGDIGKKLHTGRSRNDQTAVDLKLYLKDEIKKIESYLIEIIEILNKLAKENKKTFMPGFTHLQKAQPICFSHYVLGYVEMFRRDYQRLENCFEMMNVSPLGSAALAGTSYPIDMEYTSKILGFSRPVWNSLDGVSDRDHVIEIISDISVELIRGKSGRVFGDLMGILTTMKGIPLAYNKDMQEDKENVFDALDTVKACFSVFNGMIKTMKPNKEKMLKACYNGFINATDVADYLTNKGMSFRDAYKIVGSMVSYCIDNNKTLENLSLEEYKSFNNLFEKDIYNEIDIENCVEKRTSIGGPSEKSIDKHIEIVDKFIDEKVLELKNYKLNEIF